MTDAHEVIEIFPRSTIEQVANEIETALPSFVAAFVDVLAEVGVLLVSVSLWMEGENREASHPDLSEVFGKIHRLQP